MKEQYLAEVSSKSGDIALTSKEKSEEAVERHSSKPKLKLKKRENEDPFASDSDQSQQNSKEVKSRKMIGKISKSVNESSAPSIGSKEDNRKEESHSMGSARPNFKDKATRKRKKEVQGGNDSHMERPKKRSSKK